MDKYMEKYIATLFEQFRKANGLNDKEVFNNHKNEFTDWVVNQQKIKNRYAHLLTNMIIRGGLIAELGKGKHDSIVPDLSELFFEAIAITPHLSTFEKPSFEVYDGELVLHEEETVIKYLDGSQDYAPNCHELFNTDIRTLITQLPHNSVDINALAISSRRNNNVAIGSYGNINDKDVNDKIQLLRGIRDFIENQYCVGCEEELITENGTYQHIIVSEQKQIELVKTLRM